MGLFKKKRVKRKQKRQAPVIESLEPRILLSAHLPGLDVPDTDPNLVDDADVDRILAQALEAFEAEAPSAEAAAQTDSDGSRSRSPSRCCRRPNCRMMSRVN